MPIFTEQENLKSIVISEIDLPTEQSILTENVNTTVNAGKPDTFVELIEKYDELFNKNLTEKKIKESEKIQKRSSDDESEIENTQSILEKSQTIADPEVRKEFELDLNNYGKVAEDESAKPQDIGTEYDPNYARKVVNIPEKENGIANVFATEKSVQELMVEKVEKIVIDEPTTIEPEEVSSDFNRRKNPEIVEVFEHIFYHPSRADSFEEATPSALNIEVDFDPIQVVGEDRDALRTETDLLGSETTTFKTLSDENENIEPEGKNDLISTTDVDSETDKISELKTEEKSEDEKSLNVNDYSRSIDDITAVTETVDSSSTSFQTVTEIVEVHTEVSVSIEINKTDNVTGKPLLIRENVEHSSSSEMSEKSEKSDKSSEESMSSKSSEKEEKKKEKRKDDKNSSESSEENNAREILDTDELIILNLENEDDKKKLTEELYKDTLKHDIKKKDHPIVLPQPLVEISERKFTEETEIADHLEEKVKPTEIRNFEATTVTLYEAFEDVVTTLSDGVKLSNELRTTLDSFREPLDENKTVLDTNNEAISSKNIKNSLVNIAEEMTLENHAETAEASYFMVSIIGIISVAIVVSLFVIVKKKSSRIIFF